MYRLNQRARCHAAALAAALPLALGCAHTANSKTETARAQPTAPPVSGLFETQLTLGPEQERRAQAMAAYATAVSVELNSGLDKALPHYQKALDLDPQHAPLAIRLAQIYISRKEFTKAEAALQTAAKADPASPEPWFWLGVVRRAGEQIEKAMPALQQALKRDPGHLGATQALLEIQLLQNALADAAKTLENAFRQKSRDPGFWSRLGDVYAIALKQKPSLAKHVDAARIQQCYEKALKLSPDDPEVLIRLAGVYTDAGNFQKAADAYVAVLAKRPDAPQIREQLAMSYIRANKKDKAVVVLEEIIRRQPLRFEIYNYLGELYEDLDQPERAISNYQQSLVINPDQLPPYLRASLLQLHLKQYDAAEKTLTAAKEKFPAAFHVPFYFGLLYSARKEYERAVAAFADAETLALEAPEEIKPDSSFYFYYGAACERAGNIEKAAALFRKSIELDPNRHSAYNYLGYMWADKGIHLEEAYELIKKALAIEPDNGAYIDSLGWVLFRLGRYEEALAALRRAAELITDDAVIFDHLAEVLLTLGKTDEALVHLRRAAELDPDNKEIAEKLRKLSSDHTANN